MIPIRLRCSGCGYEWLAALLDPTYDRMSVEAVVKTQPSCPQCQSAAPKTLVSEQADLFS